MKILITGGTEGIGRAVAARLRTRGDAVTVVARRRPEGESGLAGVDFRRCDLADGADVEALLAAIPCVDAVVLCAAAAWAGELGGQSWEEAERMLRVNVWSTTRLSQHYARAMAGRGGGGIVFVGSTSGIGSSPLLAVYGAAKAYGMHLTRSLAAEFGGQGVRVRCVVAGATATGFAAKAGLGAGDREADPSEVAAAVVRALGERGGVSYASRRVWLRCRLKEWLPAGWVDAWGLRSLERRWRAGGGRSVSGGAAVRP